MKKFLAILLSAAALLGLLSGCGKEQTQPNNTADPTETLETPTNVGMLLVNVGGSVILFYDADGLVTDVEGADTNGESLAAEYNDFLGKTCGEAACDLLVSSRMYGFLDQETPFVLIKQVADSALPSNTFLESAQKKVETALQTAGYEIPVVLLSSSNLDKNGYINVESATALIPAFLSLERYDSLDGTTAPVDDIYAFRVTVDNAEYDILVDAITGSVSFGTLDNVNIGDALIDEEMDIIDPTEETNAEESTTPTEGSGDSIESEEE